MSGKVVLWNRRWFRVSLGAFLIFVGLYVMTPYLLNFKSNKGIVNSATITVVSPINGFAETNGFVVGNWVENGDLLLRVDNAFQDESFINELQTERATLLARVKALDVQAEKLAVIRSRLLTDNAKYRQHTEVQIKNQIRQLEAEMRALQALLEAAENELARSQVLHRDGVVTKARLIDSRSRRDELTARVEAAHDEIAVLRGNLAAVENGVYVGNGRNDVPYSLQRLDEVEISLADIAARRTEYVARVEQMDNQIRVETQRLAKAAAYDARAPISGIVWRNYTHTGSPVAPNNELVVLANCSDLFVDTVISNSHVDAIEIGKKATVRLLGEFDEIEGTVISVYGASMKTVDRAQPAVLPEVDGSEIVVRIRLNVLQLPRWKENYCYIGRQVSVTFDRSYVESLPNLWEMVASAY